MSSWSTLKKKGFWKMINLCIMNEGQGSQSSLTLSLPLRRNQYLSIRCPPLPPEMGVFLVAILSMGAGSQRRGTESMTHCSGKVCSLLWEGVFL